MNVAQQWRLLELVEANTDILVTDSEYTNDDGNAEARNEFWDMVTNVLNLLGKSSGKPKDKSGWRKVCVHLLITYE